MFFSNSDRDKAWQNLKKEYNRFKKIEMRDLFEKDDKRGLKYTLDLGDLTFDFSKNRFDERVLTALVELAKACDVEQKRDEMFSGLKINLTENRAVLHIALRNRSNKAICVDGRNVMGQINDVLSKMKKFSDDVRYGNFLPV